MGCADASVLEEGASFATVELKINFLKPVWTARLTAAASHQVRAHARRSCECRVTDEGGSLVAYATSTSDDVAGRPNRIGAWTCATRPRKLPSAQEVRDFIAQNLPDGATKRGARRFEDDDRDWSRKLGEAGYAGLTWPKEYGGAGAPYTHQAIFLEEMARAEAPSHLGVIGLGMAGPTIIAWGTRGAEGALPREDPERRRDLVPGLLRARRGQRPRRRAHAHRGQGRPLPRQRPEGVVVVRAHRRLLHPRRPGRAGRAALPQPHVRDRRHARARRRGAAARADHRPSGVQRDLLHRRAGAEGEPARRGRRRLAGRDDDAAARARHARLRVVGDARRRGAQARRAREGAERHRPDPARPHRARVGRAAGAEVHELPLADDAAEDGHSRPGGIGVEARLVGGKPAADEARAGDRSAAPRRRRVLDVPAASLARQHDRGRDERDPPQHRRRARARAPRGRR